ncbi:MAG: hypothetical protein ABEN55_02905 [Bradymonadaceae bacterium]
MRRRFASILTLAWLLVLAAPAVAQDDTESSGDKAKSSSDTKENSSDTKTEGETAAEGSESGSSGMAPSSGQQDSSFEETDTADTTTSSDGGGHPSTENIFVVGPHVGVLVPQVFNDLGTWPIFSLEVGVIPPMESMNNPLEIAVLARYTQPGSGGKGSDQNLGETGNEQYNWELTQRTLTLDLVGIWRGRNIASSFDPYGLIGPRVNFMETTMTAQGNGNNQFGEVKETNVEFGLVFGGGVDFQLGPGTLFGELKFGWTNLDQTLTGDTNAGAFTADVGYRFYPF